MELRDNSILRPRGELAGAFGWGDTAVLCTFAKQIQCGKLTLILPSGVTRQFTGDESGPVGVMTIHRPRAVRKLLLGGSMGFAEAYMDGDWSSDDLTGLLELAVRNQAVWRNALRGNALVTGLARIGHWCRPNSRRGSRRNIAAHYDLGNEFFQSWLDAGMTYSSGLFTNSNESLDQAQLRKFDRLIELLQISPQDHLLEIGTGWGQFALYVSRRVGCRVTAVTISKAQYAECRRKLALSGLSSGVEFRLQDYRDIQGQFDRIVAVEMIEAVGEKYWPVFFDQVRQLLAPRGRAVLQAITISDEAFEGYRRQVDFIQRYIFPGGMLPSRRRLTELARDVGLSWLSDFSHGGDYARTLACWAGRFDMAWPRIRALGFDERFRRAWQFYLGYCEAGFLTGRTDLIHVVLTQSTNSAKGPIR